MYVFILINIGYNNYTLKKRVDSIKNTRSIHYVVSEDTECHIGPDITTYADGSKKEEMYLICRELLRGIND